MDLLELAILVVLGGICGAIAEFLVGFSPGDLPLTVIVGVLGSYLGNVLGSLLGRISGGVFYTLVMVRVGPVALSLVWAIIGSALLLLALSLLRGGRRRRLISRTPTK